MGEVDQTLPRRRAIALRQPIFLTSFAFGILAFLLPIYTRRLGASALTIGGLFSIFSIMRVLLRPLVGRALDRYGRRPFFVAGLACYTAAMLLFFAAEQVTTLYLARLVQGIGSALVWIAAYTIATDLASAESRGRAVGRIDEASARGALYGALIGFALLAWLPLRSGWKVLFAGYALLAAWGTWQAWRGVPETRPAPGQSKVQGPQPFPLASPFAIRHSPFARLMLIVFITGAANALISPLLIIFLQDKFSTDVGMLALAFVPAALVWSFLPSRMGQISDHWGRLGPMVIGLAGSGLVSLLLPWLPSLGWLTLLWALEALGLVVAAPAQEALVADLTGGEVRGTGYGFYTFAASLGATVGPLVGGWLYDVAGHAAPFTLNGIALLVIAALVPVLLGKGR